jgi:hypothetical protein
MDRGERRRRAGDDRSGEFLDRMAWLPTLLRRLDQPVPRGGLTG